MKFRTLATKLLKSGLIVGIGISLASCAGSNCAGWAPIRPSKDDKLTDGTAKQILAHDEFGAKQGCDGFKPKGRGLF